MAGLFSTYSPYTQGYNQTYTQYYQQPNYSPIQPSQTFNTQPPSIFYATEEEMRAVRIPNGTQATGFDKEKSIFYIKTADIQGKTYFEKFEYKKIDENQSMSTIENESKFVLKDDLKNLATKDDLSVLAKKDDFANFVSKEEFNKFISKFTSMGVNDNGENSSTGSQTI